MQRALFITGGGSGLGAAAAFHFAARGWRIGLAGRDGAKLRKVATSITETHGSVESHPLDVADSQALESAIVCFRPDALFCSAGILDRAEVWDALTPERFAHVMGVNAGGTFNACSAAMKFWRRENIMGDIVNVSSLAGIRGQQRFAGFVAYAASKHAVVGLTEALALEGKPHGIRVNAIAPGAFRSPMSMALGLSPHTMPEAIVPTVEFLLDRARSAALTGITIEIRCNDA